MNRRAQTLTVKDNRIFVVYIMSDGYHINGASQDFYYRRYNGLTPRPFTGRVDTLRQMAKEARA